MCTSRSFCLLSTCWPRAMPCSLLHQTLPKLCPVPFSFGRHKPRIWSLIRGEPKTALAAADSEVARFSVSNGHTWISKARSWLYLPTCPTSRGRNGWVDPWVRSLGTLGHAACNMCAWKVFVVGSTWMQRVKSDGYSNRYIRQSQTVL